MNGTKKLLALLLLMTMLVSVLVSCGGGDTPDLPGGGGGDNPPAETVDYAASVKLDMNSETVKSEVTVKSFIDGDTTHFHVPTSLVGTSVLKARYLAVDTPESTGKIEEWGKRASKFTRSKLESATSIIIESDTATWNADSTGGRYLVWVWYKTADMTEYRNLNIELLQEGLAIASKSANNRYGTTCMSAIAQAKADKLVIYSNGKDPDFPYGEATELTLRELRTNIKEYEGMKVAFEAVISNDHGNSLYVESYDAETEMYYGISVYYGYNFDPFGLQIMKVGNKLRIVGTVSYYETGGTYQVSGITYNFMDTENPNNIALIEKADPSYVLTAPETFKNGKITLPARVLEDEEYVERDVEFDYAYLAMNTSLSMTDLEVKRIYTTTNDESSSKGAMTITCEKDGVTVDVRTVVLYDSDGNLITSDYFEGKVIDVKGTVDYFDGTYQIKVFSINDITIKN